MPHLLLADVVPHSVHGGVAAQLLQVAAGVTLRLLGDLLQINGVAQLTRKKNEKQDEFLVPLASILQILLY